MEPGTFKDRLLMEGDPHQLIEGMIIWRPMPSRQTSPISFCAANTTGRRALAPGHRRGYDGAYLGKNILGSGLQP